MRTALLAAAAVLLAAVPASAADPGRWRLASVDRIPLEYGRGLVAEVKQRLLHRDTHAVPSGSPPRARDPCPSLVAPPSFLGRRSSVQDKGARFGSRGGEEEVTCR